MDEKAPASSSRVSQNGDFHQDGSPNHDQDTLDMHKLGKQQQFSRNFNFWSIFGFASTAMITWEGLLVTFTYSLTNGGPSGSLYGFLFVWIGTLFLSASLAELMSMWPTSGGQYHWTYTLSPKLWAPLLSYICGWQSVIAWQAAPPAGAFLVATSVQGLAVLGSDSGYGAERWQGTLIMWLIVAVLLVVGIFGSRMLPRVEYVALVVHTVGFVVVIACIATLSPTLATNGQVWRTWYNNDYPTQGVSFLVGLQGIVFSWLGADGPIHMAEEIKNASRVVPWSLMASGVFNGALGFAMLIAVFYYGPFGQDLLDSLETPTGYPFLAILQYATGSVAGAIGLATIIIVMFALAILMVFTASTRELWAFARDKGVPGASLLARVHKPSKLPLYCYAVTAITMTLLALINIGSSIAFNAIISLTIAGFFGSYIFPITLVLWRRIQAIRGKGPELPWGPWGLGKWSGVIVNAISLAFILIIFVFSFFPIEPLPSLTVQAMNWSSLAYGAITIFAILFWIVHGRKTFKGPVRDAANGEIEPVLNWGQGVQFSST